MTTMRWTEQSEGSAPTIKNHSVTYFAKKCFVYGGYDGRRNHATLLIYDMPTQRWIRPVLVDTTNNGNNNNGAPVAGDQFPPVVANNNNNNNGGSLIMGDPNYLVQGTPPPGRNGHSATLAVSDLDEEDENGRIIIIGGWLGTGPLAASDTYVLDISNGGRQLRWYQPAVKGVPPGPCNMHSADFVAARKEVYVFRGGNGREYLNDLHALHAETLTWRRVETTGAIPQQRANHSSAILPETGELFIFGGWNGQERLNDIHILDTATSNWTCPHVGGVLPHPRAGMTLTALHGRLYLFGGSGTSAKCFQDLQILDRQEMAWLDVTQYEPRGGGQPRGGHYHYSPNDPHHPSHHHHGEEGRFRFVDPGNQQPQFGFGGDQHHHYGGMQHHEQGDMRFVFGGGHDDHHNRQHPGGIQEGGQAGMGMAGHQGGSSANPHHAVGHTFTSSRAADWRSRDMAVRRRPSEGGQQPLQQHTSPNPNDEDTVPTVIVHGRGPGRRAGHTATAVNRKIYIFGGSCGSDYLNDFFLLDTDPPPHAVVEEPTSLQLLERRLRHFFNDEEFSDVTFVVQGQKVYGHKMVLSIVSDCFRAMFTTGFRESEALEIEIPDCSYAAFLAVMEYIYTGTPPSPLQMSQQQQLGPQDGGGAAAMATDQNLGRIVEILELADRFFLDHLKQICETLLQPALNSDTVEFLLSVAQKTNATQLQAICEHFLRNREGQNA